jgi:hypothetical protein
LVISPFHARWKKIEQAVIPRSKGGITPAEPAVPGHPLPPSLSAQFADELDSIGGKVYRLPEQELRAKLAEFLHEHGIARVCVDSVGAQFIPKISFVMEPDPTIQVGVTGALAGIADTGSLVLVGGEGRPLTASLLPDIHIAILRVSDLVPTLSDALRRPEVANSPAAVIITGPSRTADIEMTLTIGVHGPKELHVFLVD